MKCAVANCTNSSNKMTASECSLFAFPVHPQLRKQWIAFCRQSKEFDFKNGHICMEHFAKEDFGNSMQFEMGFAKKRMLKPSAVPSIYKPYDDPERSQRVQRREDKKMVMELLRNNDAAASQEVTHSSRMDSDSGSMSSEAHCVYIYPNVTKVDPSQFSVNEDLESLSGLLTMQKQLSPKSFNIRLCDNNKYEECSSDVDMQSIELINEKQFDVDDTFMYMTNVEQHSEETEPTEEEQLKILQNLLLLHTTRSIACETDTSTSRSIEVQVDLKEKDTCGYIAVSSENQVLAYYLRCYYCAEKYPLGYWQQFIKHMNTAHNILEKMKADVDLKFATSSESSVHTKELCILENVVLPKLTIPPATTNEPRTTNINETTNANSRPEQTLQANQCNTKCTIYNSNFSWKDVWDSDSDAESTLDKNSATYLPTVHPNIDHCYSQLPRYQPLANTTSNQNDMKPAKKKLKSNEHKSLANITLNQNDVKPPKNELKSSEDESLDHNYVKPAKTEYEIDFDHTESAIVMDFLDLLTSFPVLWYSRTKLARAYDFGVENLYKMLNIRWELNFTPASFRKSLDKIKVWYRSTLANTETGSARFEEYFQKCTEFLPASDDGQPPDLLCDICNESCHDDAYLLVHKFKAHAVGQLPYECGICGTTFFQVDNLGSHLHRHKKKYPLPKLLIFPAGKGKRRMKCKQCKEIFYQEAAMEVHMKTNACDIRPYFCNLCDEKFTLLNEYRAHWKQSHKRRHKCELCGHEFSQLNYYNDHMKIHRRRFDYLCDICGKLFVRQRSFIEHKQCVHQGMAHCAICNSDFMSSGTLHSHRVKFHLVREGTIEELFHFKDRRRDRMGARKYERVYDNSTSKRYRLRCPLCPATYYGYDSLYAHGLRSHGKQLQDPCKKPVSAKVKAPRPPKRINIASVFPELIHVHEDAANIDVTEGNASNATADESAPSEVTAAVADNAWSTEDETTTALVMTPAITAEPSVPELVIAEEEIVQSTTESKPSHHIKNSRKKRGNANVKPHKKTKCKNMASPFPELTYIYEDAANIATTEDNVSSEGTAAVADSASSGVPATAFVTTSAVTVGLSMPELLTAEDETVQATTELKQLNVDKFKIGSDRLFSGDVYEDAEFEYVLNATVMELERY